MTSPKQEREIDARIEREVFGRVVQSAGCNLLTSDTRELYEDEAAARFARNFPTAPKQRTPAHYSTDIGDAWKVVERMTQGPGEYCDLANRWDGIAPSWIARFNGSSAEAETAPLAICLAALKTRSVSSVGAGVR